MENQNEVTRKLAKYIFIDVVQFSRRSAEAQSDIVKSFNSIVHQVLEQHNVNKDNDNECILIPTGDGMCISLLNHDLPFDSHIQIALSILQAIDEHNKATENETRKYQVRIGINQNTDILVTDINGRKNVAGAGINMASRVMDKADGGQILVSQAVHHELEPSEIYMDKFKKFTAIGKHNIHFEVCQYILENLDGLNINLPKSFEQPEKVEEKFPKQIAYFIGFIIRNRNLFIANKKNLVYQKNLTLVCWLLSTDTVTKVETPDNKNPIYITYKFGEATVEEQVNYYGEIDYKFLMAFQDEIGKSLSLYSQYFEDYFRYFFITDKGKEKLKLEWIEIWEELELNNYI